jgi:hypothetical protein
MGDDDKVDIIAFGPSLGYYAKINPSATEAKGSFYAYGQGYVTFGSLKDEHSKGPKVTQYGGNLGLLYMVSSAVGADLSIKVQQDSWKDEGDPEATTGTTLRIGLGLTAFIF